MAWIMLIKSLKNLLKNSLIFGLLFALSGCSFIERSSLAPNGKGLTYRRLYLLTDKSGSFTVERETGFGKEKKSYFTKYRILEANQNRPKVLEQSVVFSTPGILRKKLKILRPKFFQYQVWFKRQRYLAEGKIDPKKRAMKITLKSPEPQWNKKKSFKFPESKGLYCFFSQVLECAAMTGFLNKAIEKKAGKMNFYLLFEGYPYFQEQYLNVPSGFFNQAFLVYDGKSSEGQVRFSLKFGKTTIFYFISKSLEMIKMFWPSQGLSMVEKRNE